MSATKLKNRRRFITRDARLDIPEDNELRISSPGGVDDDDESDLLPLVAHRSSLDRTWPRRTWRPGVSFAPTLPLQSSVSSEDSQLLPVARYPQGSLGYTQGPLGYPQGPLGHRSPPRHPQPWQGGGGGSVPSSPMCGGSGWRYRSQSTTTSPTACLSSSSLQQPTTTSELCIKSRCCLEPSDDVTPFDSIEYLRSPRQLAPPVARFVPEITDIPSAQPTSGQDRKQRSFSLNDEGNHRSLLPHPLQSSQGYQGLRPGSVLHRALVWEKSVGVMTPTMTPGSPNTPFAGISHGNPVESRSKVTDCNPNVSESLSWDSGHGIPEPERLLFPVPVRFPSYEHRVQGGGRHSLDLGRSGLHWGTTNGNSHRVERVHSAAVSPVGGKQVVGGFTTWKCAQDEEESNKDHFAGTEATWISKHETGCGPIPVTSGANDETLSTNPGMISSANGSGFSKPFRSKSLRLLTFELPANEPFTFGNDSVTSSSSFRAKSVADESQTGSDIAKPKISLSTMTLTSEIQGQKDEQPEAVSSRTESRGFSTGNLVAEDALGFNDSVVMATDLSKGQGKGQSRSDANTSAKFSTAFSTERGSAVVDSSPSRGAFPSPIGSNLVVKRLTQLSRIPFQPSSRLDHITATKDSPDPVKSDPKSFSSALTGVRDERKSGGKENWNMEKLPSGGYISRSLTEPAVKFHSNNVGAVSQNLPNFTSAKELLLEGHTEESLLGGNSGDTLPPVTEPATISRQPVDPGRAPDLVNGSGVPKRFIRVLLKSSSQLKDESIQQKTSNRIGRVRIGSVEAAVQSGSVDHTGVGHVVHSAEPEIDPLAATRSGADTKIMDILPEQQEICHRRILSDDVTKRRGTEVQSFEKILTRSPQNPAENLFRGGKDDVDQSTRLIRGSNRRFSEMISTETAPVVRRPFEIVRKRLIVPEPLSWFRPKDDQPKPVTTNDSILSSNRTENRTSNRNKFGLADISIKTESNDRWIREPRMLDDEMESLISLSVPTTLDRKKSVPAQTAAVKCSDLEAALRKIESDMDIIAKAGVKTHPGFSRKAATNPPHNQTAKENYSGDVGPGLFGYSSATKAPPAPTTTTTTTFRPDSLPDYHHHHSGVVTSSSVTTELDQAIALLAQPKQTEKQSTSSQIDEQTGGNTSQIPHTKPADGRKFRGETTTTTTTTPSFVSPSPPRQDTGEKGTWSKPSFQVEGYASPVGTSVRSSSCASIEPVRAVKLNPVVVANPKSRQPEVVVPFNRRSHHLELFLAREDSFDRPDSPAARKPLPLPKDSVIMRHRMHQKELRGTPGGRGTPGDPGRPIRAGSLSSSSGSEASDEEEGWPPALRLAPPKRTKRSRSVPQVKVTQVKRPEVTESNEDDRDDSLFSSSASIRPISLDGSSLLSEENL